MRSVSLLLLVAAGYVGRPALPAQAAHRRNPGRDRPAENMRLVKLCDVSACLVRLLGAAVRLRPGESGEPVVSQVERIAGESHLVYCLL